MSKESWHEANQRYLTAALAQVRRKLEGYGAHVRSEQVAEMAAMVHTDPQSIAAVMPAPPTLETLCRIMHLSPFERDVLLLCAGMELDASFAPLCAAAQGNPQTPYPTFSLALAALPEAHWSALSPAAPLRYWQLVTPGSNGSLTQGPLRIDERILHYLTGVQHLDERLTGFVRTVPLPGDLPPSHSGLAERIAAAWSRPATSARSTNGTQPPAVHIHGGDPASRYDVAAAACATLGLQLYAMPAQAIPSDPHELEILTRLWEREAALSGSALLVDCDDIGSEDILRQGMLNRLIESNSGALIVASRDRRLAPRRTLLAFEVRPPSTDEQRTLWQQALGETVEQLNGAVDGLVAQFSLRPAEIHAVCAEARGRAATGDEETSPEDLGSMLWDICRTQARPDANGLAQHIDPVARWEDLVLPPSQKQILREIAIHVRHRLQVYETWGFAAKSARGLGISTLFSGPSGTGKTMAAEVLANELRLDLYRIDLSQVVSKYIGETEKNLRQVFDAVEGGGAILLFDEADALFGKRSEVRDSHDRYANIEISYLLQRMEAYQGLAILTTNMQSVLDKAFMRRIRFVVKFPFPDAAQRAEIWQRIFPIDTPVDGVDVEKLARLNVTGGNIRNIALYAAFLAAEESEPVHMHHLLRAAQVEYDKLEKPLTESEIGSWV